MTIIVVQRGVQLLACFSCVVCICTTDAAEVKPIYWIHRGIGGSEGADHRLMIPQDFDKHNTSLLHALADDCMALQVVQYRILHDIHNHACIALSSGCKTVSCTHLIIFIYLIQQGFCRDGLALFKV